MVLNILASDFVAGRASNKAGEAMEPITMYTTSWCPDCRRVKSFLEKRGVPYREVNIEEDESAEDTVIKANNGMRTASTNGVPSATMFRSARSSVNVLPASFPSAFRQTPPLTVTCKVPSV